jgi:hypothetical protein
MADPAVARSGRSSPQGERFYASNQFEMRKWERDRMFSLAGDQRDHSCNSKDWSTDSDYSPDVSYTKRSLVYKNLSIKGRMSEPYLHAPSPGPGQYKSAASFADAGVRLRGATINARRVDSRLFMEATCMPGPAAYNIRAGCGSGRPAFSLSGRPMELPAVSPTGPGDYHIPTVFDKYNIAPIGWEPPFSKRSAHYLIV